MKNKKRTIFIVTLIAVILLVFALRYEPTASRRELLEIAVFEFNNIFVEHGIHASVSAGDCPYIEEADPASKRAGAQTIVGCVVRNQEGTHYFDVALSRSGNYVYSNYEEVKSGQQ
jgi:hypothetical protein